VHHRAVAPSSRFATLSIVIAALALGLAACGDDDPPPVDPPDAGVDPKCAEATTHSDLAWIQENILTPSCADFTPCHKGRALQAQGLNLEDTKSRENLVGIPSVLFPQYDLIKAGDPDSSYLMIVLGHKPGPLPEKGTMPYNNPMLCVEKRDAIERWIANGALDSEPDAGVADAAVSVDARTSDAGPTD
jgi:hypothetical protein